MLHSQSGIVQLVLVESQEEPPNGRRDRKANVYTEMVESSEEQRAFKQRNK